MWHVAESVTFWVIPGGLEPRDAPGLAAMSVLGRVQFGTLAVPRWGALARAALLEAPAARS